MKRKTRILAIAPYEALKDTMIRIANERNDIELTVEVGVITEGAAIAKNHENEDFDAILSRGGTKLEIDKVTDKPVFDIPISYFDLLNIIKLVENYKGKIAILAYENIAKSARILCDIFHYDYNISIINIWHNAKEKVQQLKDEGYTLIIGDAVSVKCAEDMGLHSILLTSGPDSVRDAFDTVVNFCTYYSQLKTKVDFFQSFVQAQNDRILVLNEKGEIEFSTFPFEKKSLQTFCRNMIPAIQAGEVVTAHKKLSEGLFMVYGNKNRIGNTTYYFFNIQKSSFSISYLTDSSSISVYNSEDFKSEDFETPNLLHDINSAFYNRCMRIVDSTSPILIVGESGTEKEKIACQLYVKSKSAKDPLYIVNCNILTQKELDFLILSEKSPLYTMHSSVLFKNIHMLPKDLFEQLIDGLQNMSRSKTNRIMFTDEVMPAPDKTQERYYRCDTIKHRLNCMVVEIPPLRGNEKEILNYSLLFIQQQNKVQGTNIVGLDPEAITLLQDYSWPQNTNQLRRVLSEAFVATTTPWITAKTIQQILATEKRSSQVYGVKEQINLKQPLSGIIYDTINQVLADENFNQTKTAHRLGISRTTLWRLLKK